MTKHLSKWAAEAPDEHCVNCGTGVFTEGTLKHLGSGKVALPSILTGADGMSLCGNCTQLEGALIIATGTSNHPERLAQYTHMKERSQ